MGRNVRCKWEKEKKPTFFRFLFVGGGSVRASLKFLFSPSSLLRPRSFDKDHFPVRGRGGGRKRNRLFSSYGVAHLGNEGRWKGDFCLLLLSPSVSYGGKRTGVEPPSMGTFRPKTEKPTGKTATIL